MKLFLLGDFYSDNGPGNANKQIMQALLLKYEIIYSKSSNKLGRIWEMFNGIRKSDIVIICSKSQLNYFGVKFAKLGRKKIIYVMHGYSSYESKIENPQMEESAYRKLCEYEKFIFENVDKIVCVSKKFMNYMKKEFSVYSHKFDYIYNIIDMKKIEQQSEKFQEKRERQIISIGGGLKRKNINAIAEATDEFKEAVQLCVIGKNASDGEKIKEHSNVIWYEHLEYGEVIRKLNQSMLYVQNSMFETFGLAVIEALYSGCSLLISAEVGCLDLFDNITDNDIITDTNNIDEISRKIEFLLHNPNNSRLRMNFNVEKVSKDYQIISWNRIIEELKKV